MVGGKDGEAFLEAPAHRDDRDARLTGGHLGGRHQVRQGVATGFDHHDFGSWGDGVGPLDIGDQLTRPVLKAAAGGLDGWPGAAAGLVDDRQE